MLEESELAENNEEFKEFVQYRYCLDDMGILRTLHQRLTGPILKNIEFQDIEEVYLAGKNSAENELEFLKGIIEVRERELLGLMKKVLDNDCLSVL